jgi:hypothetical protein
MMLEVTNVRRSENSSPCFADLTGLITGRKRCKFKTADVFNMTPHLVSPTQRFCSFLVGLGHVTDAKGALGRLAFLGNDTTVLNQQFGDSQKQTPRLTPPVYQISERTALVQLICRSKAEPTGWSAPDSGSGGKTDRKANVGVSLRLLDGFFCTAL